jgi:hypothetical protein
MPPYPLVYFITLGRKTKNTGVVSLIGNEGSCENDRMILFDIGTCCSLVSRRLSRIADPLRGGFQSQNRICVKYVGRG